MSEHEVNAQIKENGDVVMYYYSRRVRIKASVMKYMTLDEETIRPLPFLKVKVKGFSEDGY